MLVVKQLIPKVQLLTVVELMIFHAPGVATPELLACAKNLLFDIGSG